MTNTMNCYTAPDFKRPGHTTRLRPSTRPGHTTRLRTATRPGHTTRLIRTDRKKNLRLKPHAFPPRRDAFSEYARPVIITAFVAVTLLGISSISFDNSSSTHRRLPQMVQWGSRGRIDKRDLPPMYSLSEKTELKDRYEKSDMAAVLRNIVSTRTRRCNACSALVRPVKKSPSETSTYIHKCPALAARPPGALPPVADLRDVDGDTMLFEWIEGELTTNPLFLKQLKPTDRLRIACEKCWRLEGEKRARTRHGMVSYLQRLERPTSFMITNTSTKDLVTKHMKDWIPFRHIYDAGIKRGWKENDPNRRNSASGSDTSSVMSVSGTSAPSSPKMGATPPPERSGPSGRSINTKVDMKGLRDNLDCNLKLLDRTNKATKYSGDKGFAIKQLRAAILEAAESLTTSFKDDILLRDRISKELKVKL